MRQPRRSHQPTPRLSVAALSEPKERKKRTLNGRLRITQLESIHTVMCLFMYVFCRTPKLKFKDTIAISHRNCIPITHFSDLHYFDVMT